MTVPYFPPEGGRFRLSLGLKVLDPADWIEVDEHLAEELEEKARLTTTRRDDVFRALPGSVPAQAELLSCLADHLLQRFPELYTGSEGALQVAATGRTVTPDPSTPLLAASALVQEDILLLQSDGESFRLVAGILCFPTRWRLAEKMGKPLRDIHAPVPDYDRALARPMDRLFNGLTPDRMLWRLNFSLLDDPALFQPTGHHRADAGADLTIANLGEKLVFRVERQTLRLLPGTRTAVFTVRIYRAPLGEVVQTPERAADLISAIGEMPPEMRRYKSMEGFLPVLRDWLGGRA